MTDYEHQLEMRLRDARAECEVLRNTQKNLVMLVERLCHSVESVQAVRISAIDYLVRLQTREEISKPSVLKAAGGEGKP